MVKLAAREIDRFLDGPDPSIRFVLLYGADQGQVRLRADRLVAAVVEDPKDPFLVTEFASEFAKGGECRLAEEAGAQSLLGGRRVVRIRAGGDIAADAIAEFLAVPEGDALLVVEAGKLAPRSPLRKLAENEDLAKSVACYPLEGHEAGQFVSATMRSYGLEITDDARALLADRLGVDQRLAGAEMEKLAIFVGGGTVGASDVEACVGDASSHALDDLAFTVGAGDCAALETGFARLLGEGALPVPILRSVLRHFQRLHSVAGVVADGGAYDQAVRSLRPPLFYMRKSDFARQARAWPLAALGSALDRLLSAEGDCKSSGQPTRSVCHRALLGVAIAGRRYRSRQVRAPR